MSSNQNLPSKRGFLKGGAASDTKYALRSERSPSEDYKGFSEGDSFPLRYGLRLVLSFKKANVK